MAYNFGGHSQQPQQGGAYHGNLDEETRLLYQAFKYITIFLESSKARRSTAESQVLSMWLLYRLPARNQIFECFVECLNGRWTLRGEAGSVERAESLTQLGAMAFDGLARALITYKARAEAQLRRESPPASNPLLRYQSSQVPFSGSSAVPWASGAVNPQTESELNSPDVNASTRRNSTHSQKSDEMFVMDK